MHSHPGNSRVSLDECAIIVESKEEEFLIRRVRELLRVVAKDDDLVDIVLRFKGTTLQNVDLQRCQTRPN